MFIVTGGAGFIGSAVLRTLNEHGITDILVVDNLSSSEKWKNLRNAQFNDYVHKTEFISHVEKNCMPEKVEAIIHMGACSSTTERNADYMLSNNYEYTKKLSQWAMARNVRFIYASSAATYGDGSLGFSDAHETTPLLRPLNVYGYSKFLYDFWALRTGAINKVTGLKFFNVFGPNEYHKGEQSSVIYKAYSQILETEQLKLFCSYNPNYKDGEQLRDFVYVKDCCNIIYELISRPDAVGLYNIGTGVARSWNDLAKATFAAMNRPVSIEYIDMPAYLRDRYQYYTKAETAKLQKLNLGISFHSLEEAITDYVQNYLMKEEANM